MNEIEDKINFLLSINTAIETPKYVVRYFKHKNNLRLNVKLKNKEMPTYKGIGIGRDIKESIKMYRLYPSNVVVLNELYIGIKYIDHITDPVNLLITPLESYVVE